MKSSEGSPRAPGAGRSDIRNCERYGDHCRTRRPEVDGYLGACGAIFGQAVAPADGLADIRPPFFYLHSYFWYWVTLAALLLGALVVFLIIKSLPKKILSAKSAYDLALEQLQKARALLREDEPMPYAVLVSETIRSYLGQRFQSPSTRRTTEEFLRQMDADSTTLLAEHRSLLREFLQSCDLVKFARYQPTLAELELVQQRATNFVTATRPPPPPQGKAA